MKVLIVEDDFSYRLILQEILKNFGTIHMAANGLEAVEAVRVAILAEQPYDLICMDIEMPQMDGQTALKEIRAMERKIGISAHYRAKIVMTTSLSDTNNVTEAIREQCDGYLLKPFRRASVLEHLKKFGLLS